MKDKSVTQKPNTEASAVAEVTQALASYAAVLSKDPDPDKKIAAAQWLKILRQALEKEELPRAA